MPKEKNFKRLVRARMAKTGESYATARAQLEGTFDRSDTSVEVGAVLALVHDLPAQIDRIRIVSERVRDEWLCTLAADRAQAVLGRRVRQDPGRSADVSTTRSECWMELDEATWTRPMVPPRPRRWHEVLRTTKPDGSEVRLVRGGDGLQWWEKGLRMRSEPGDTMRMTPSCAWVVSNAWAALPARLEVLGPATIAGRRAVRIAMTRRPGALTELVPFHFPPGDTNELAIDRATGMTLSIVSFLDGEPFHRDEVVDIELGAQPPDNPSDLAEQRATSSRAVFRDLDKLADEVEFTVLAPTWLPADTSLLSAVILKPKSVDHGSTVALVYSGLSGKLPIQIRESTATEPAPDVFEWEQVEQNDRTISISDNSDREGRRIAQVTLSGTRATIRATLAAHELVAVASSLAEVQRSGRPR